jgi:hypothetical protein
MVPELLFPDLAVVGLEQKFAILDQEGGGLRAFALYALDKTAYGQGPFLAVRVQACRLGLVYSLEQVKYLFLLVFPHIPLSISSLIALIS